jgi:hypothetical protein
MILHHEDDDVPDLRQQVRASRQGWPRQRPDSLAARAPGPAFHLNLLESSPHDRANSRIYGGDIVSRGKPGDGQGAGVLTLGQAPRK